MVLMLEIWGKRKSAPIEGGKRVYWNAEYYTFAMEGDDDSNTSIRDENQVREIISSLVDGSWRNEKPERAEGFIPWFTIVVKVSDTRKNVSTYTIDFHKWNNCPFEAISEGMRIYKGIKRNIKKSAKGVKR